MVLTRYEEERRQQLITEPVTDQEIINNASLLYPDFFSGFSLHSFSSEDTSKIAHHQPAPLNQPESPVVDIEFTNISVIIEEMKKG